MKSILESIKEEYKKYATVILVCIIAILVVYKDFAHKVHVQDLVSKSILHLAPGHVYGSTPGTVSGPKHISGSPEPLYPEKGSPDKYIPPEARLIVTPKDPKKKLSDVVNVNVTGTYGFTLEPGLDLSVITPGIGLDLKWLYVEKLGTEIGVTRYFGPYNRFSPTVGLSYRLDHFRALRNTELKLSYAPLLDFPVTVDVRVGF